MKTILIGALAAAGALAMAASAAAEAWTDYTPEKGVWEVVTVEVAPGHMDDYLTGLSNNWRKGVDWAKAQGVIDYYGVKVKLNDEAGANVMMITHFPSLANLEPDKARFDARMAAMKAFSSKEKQAAIVAGYNEYRKFVSDEFWTDISFPK
jgi:opacity protein-like surface antigen